VRFSREPEQILKKGFKDIHRGPHSETMEVLREESG
jgi:hypothetical protein